jgi:MOSC domain-containing protein YiiM
MTRVGKIISLFHSTSHGHILTDKMQLDVEGIVGDKHYGKELNRSVLIVSLTSYDIARESNIDISYGALGENMLIDYNPYHLEIGSRLRIGDELLLEISQHSTLCKSFAKIDSKLPKLLKNDRGIFAKVINAGSIKDGDAIYLV